MEILILLILIFLNGFFSLSEIALVSSNRTRLEQLEKSGIKGATIAISLKDSPDIFLSASHVGMTLVSLITGAFGGMTISSIVTPFIESINIFASHASAISMVVTMFTISYITVLFGELFPKTLAITKPEKIATIVSRPYRHFIKVFYPFVKLLSTSNRIITKSIGLNNPSDSLTEEEIRILLKTASLEGVLEEELSDIQENVFHFYDKRAKHLMTHRVEVDWVNLEKTEEEIKREIEQSQHSKLVCAHGSLDRLEGILNVWDYYKAQLANKSFSLTEIIAKPIVIHENTTASNVLKQMKESSSHISIIVDEYGDFEGIITFHDIMESFLGLIPDEGEIERPEYTIDKAGSYTINGDTPVEMLTDIISDFQLDFEQIDYSTVAGFIIDQVNEIPKVGDSFSFDGYQFSVIKMDGNRIDKVRIEHEYTEE